MIIYLDTKLYKFLSTYSLKNENIELELRFGQYKDGKFKPDIGQEKYVTIDNYLKNNKELIHKIETEQSKVEIFSDGIRKISTSEKSYYQKKNKLYTGDIEYKDFVLRLSESEEIPIIPEQSNPLIIETRYRNRTIYHQKTYAFYYAITEVTTITEKLRYTTYELEIEYNIKPQTIQYLINMVQDSINYILPLMVLSYDKNRFSYLSLPEESYIRSLYSSLYIKEPKPVNLNRFITPDLESLGYSVTNKLDGERFILLFTQIGFYAFNNRKMEKYDSRNYDPYLQNIIFFSLDTEFFEGKYYIFDCMIYNGEKIIEKNHQERISYAEDIIKKLSPIWNNFLNLKNFYRGDLKYHTQQLLDTISKEKNDGIIYTSNSRYNSNIYKWKYPDKMSIDFSVYKIGKNLYELYVKDNVEGFPVNVPFHGNNLYELKEALYLCEDKDLKQGGIYEFGYNNDTQTFILFRERPDKIDPNYITVAENVWTDIKNPYTSTELITLLSPKVLEQYRKYQNGIKRKLIEEYCYNKNVLDLGSGRGGDLGKYDSVNVNYLWCVEPNEKNYTELLRRLNEKKSMKEKTSLIKTFAQDTDMIVKQIRDTIIYESPIIFKANIFFSQDLIQQNPLIRSFEVLSFNSVDHLKTVISEVLEKEFSQTLNKNSFVITLKDELLNDEYLYSLDSMSDNLQIYVRLPNQKETQNLGGDFKEWFPKIEGIDYNKLKITDEGIYSLTKYMDSLAIIKSMENIIGEENMEGLTILDGTANVGGDTIRFAMNFNKVISVELNKENFEVLSNNVNVYNFSDKVELINGDITKFYNKLQLLPDVLYLDPPWGGKSYKDFDEEKMVIFLSNMSLTRFIGNILLSPNKPKYIFIKLPINYNINSLKDMPYVCDMQVYKIRKFYLVSMIIDNKNYPLKKSDILTSFFSLSFFFFKDTTGRYTDLDNLVNTIDKTIKDGGYFIGTTIDGKTTKKLLNSSPNKKFDFDGGYIKFKDENDEVVELLIKDTIVETQIESLVDFELLQLKLSEKNIYLDHSSLFLPTDLLTETENILNSLYRTFVFRRSTKRQFLFENTIKDIQKNFQSYNLKSPLTTNQVINILSNVNHYKNCQKYIEELTVFKEKIDDYTLLNFNYTPDLSKLIYSKKYKNLTNMYKEYFNGTIASINKVNGILKPEGINPIDNYTVFNIGKSKKFFGPIEMIFDYGIEIIMSCLYQLYNTIYLLSSLDMNLTNPNIFITKEKDLSKIDIDEPLYIKIKKDFIVNVLNYSYTYESSNLNIEFPFFGNFNNYTLIEILQYFSDSYKKSIYNRLLRKEDPSEFTDFLIKFINIKENYINFSLENKIDIKNGLMNGYNDNNDTSINVDISFVLQNNLNKLEEEIDRLNDEDYNYFEKMIKVLNKVKHKVSNKIYKWTEVLDLLSIQTIKNIESNIQNYQVFSSGFMPEMFIYAMNSKFKGNKFLYHKNVKNSIIAKEKISVDLYTIYTNKNIYNSLSFLQEIIIGLNILKEGGTMLFNMKNFFGKLEMSILGLLIDMFDGKISIVKPYSSRITDSEIFIICEKYKKIDSIIETLKTVKSNNYIPGSLNVRKYSGLLLACYTFYGRQEFFINKDIELFKKLKLLKIKESDITSENLINNSDKFINYYTKQRLEFNKYINKIIKNY
jgi:predicted RNA methylase